MSTKRYRSLPTPDPSDTLVIDIPAVTRDQSDLASRRYRTKQGTLIDKGYLYRLLKNRVRRGEAVHKGKAYPGEQDAIIDGTLWERDHTILQ